MASSVPVAGETFTFGCSAISQADTDIFQAGATIAAGDFQRSINGGAFANLDNTPTVAPAAGKRIQFVISAAETTSAGAGGEIYIVASDQAGDEWQDFAVTLRVFASNLDALATAASIAALNDLSADEVWDELIAAHLGIGSTGAALNAAGAAGDPWASLLPAAYGAGTAGNIVGNIIERVWAYASRTLTQSAASVAEAVQGSTLTILRGDTFSASLTNIGALTDYVSLDFTVKRKRSDSDDDAILRIRKNASGVGDGLLRFNKELATTPANGSITIDDLATGDVTIVLAEEQTDDLAVYTGYHYDIQMITATGVLTLTEGYCNVVADVTRLIA